MKKNLYILLLGWLMCIIVAGVVIFVVFDSKHEHDYSLTITAPTCTEQGFTTYTCECGASYVDNYTDARGHNYIDGSCSVCNAEHACEYSAAIAAPTCTQQGYTTHTCTCGASYVDDYTDPTGHSFVNGKCEKCGSDHDCKYTPSVTAPTCTERGFTTYTCTCGASYVDDYTDPTGHNFVNGICKKCGSDHDCKYTPSVTAPTCTERGFTTFTCECGASYIGDYTNSLGHNYEKKVTAPTCTERGFTTYTCTCGHSYISDYTDPTGHNFVNGKCEKCGSDHDCKNTPSVTAPTCTERGFTTYTCTCGASYIGDYTDALGHNYIDGKCERCGEETTKVESISLNKTTLTIRKGNEETLTATVSPADAYDKSAVWSSSDESIVTVENGVITAVDYGVATVNVTTVDGNKTAKCTVTVGEFKFTEIVESGEVVGYSVRGIKSLVGTEVSIPSVYKGKPVTEIANGAFSQYDQLLRVTIPDSVTSIGIGAFIMCRKMTSIKFPDSVTTVGRSAFSHCESLTSIEIPDSVTAIESGVFVNCYAVKSIYIGKGVTRIESHAFSGGPQGPSVESITVSEENKYFYSQNNCLIERESKTLIHGCNSSIIPADVLTIGNYAFYGCNGITGITIPDSVTSIGSSAFIYCSGLKNIVIPDSVITIDNYAFKYCRGLESITISDSVASIGIYAFEGCRSLTSITVADGNTKYYSKDNCLIEKESEILILGCKNSIIPDGINRIESYAFKNCIDLTSIIIPEGVTTIGSGAFSGCINLASITISDSVTTIESNAFENCSSLTSIIIPDSVVGIGKNAFKGCGGLTSITIPDGVTAIEEYTFNECSNLTSVTIPYGVTFIGNYTFGHCVSLTSITLPDSVNSIGYGAFYECSKLTSITIPYGVTSIDSHTFENCSSLTSITIPDSVNSIGASAFEGCSGLTNIIIPDGVTAINNSAFEDCTGLIGVTIPNSVTSIGIYAFDYCYRLISINFEGTKAEWISIEKDTGWDKYTAKYTVHCTDGDIKKQ